MPGTDIVVKSNCAIGGKNIRSLDCIFRECRFEGPAPAKDPSWQGRGLTVGDVCVKYLSNHALLLFS